MCCIAAAKKGIFINKKYLRNMFRENPHLCGFAVAKDGKVLVRKGFANFKDFWRSFRHYQDCDKVVHMRWANVGVVNIDNAHPFYVTPDLAFAHNGTIPIKTKDGKSDTRTFNELVLKRLQQHEEDFLQNPAIAYLISKAIGNSKLAFINSDGDISIINRQMGVEHEGIWFSNNDFKAFPKTVYAGRHRQGNGVQGPYAHMIQDHEWQ